MELAAEDVSDLVQQFGRGDEEMGANAVLQEIGADAASHERRDEDIRIEQ
jgi:hypothetical protein